MGDVSNIDSKTSANGLNIGRLEFTIQRELSTSFMPARKNEDLIPIISGHMQKAGLVVSQDSDGDITLIKGIYGSSGPIIKVVLTSTDALYARYSVQSHQHPNPIPQGTTLELIKYMMTNSENFGIYPRLNAKIINYEA